MFGSAKASKPKEETIPHLTNDDIVDSRKYLLRHLRDYVSWDKDDPEHIEMVCRIIDALKNLGRA